MNSDLFIRLKKMAKKEGKVVFTDEEDAFVILPLQEYEMLASDFCEEECECESRDFDKDLGEDIFADNGEEKGEEDDKELIRKVNEDIAKWREEQQKNEKTEKQKNEDQLVKVADEPETKENVLTEEERYYLEPLE